MDNSSSVFLTCTSSSLLSKGVVSIVSFFSDCTDCTDCTDSVLGRLNKHFANISTFSIFIICLISITIWKLLEEHLIPLISKMFIIKLSSVISSYSTCFSFSSKICNCGFPKTL